MSDWRAFVASWADQASGMLASILPDATPTALLALFGALALLALATIGVVLARDLPRLAVALVLAQGGMTLLLASLGRQPDGGIAPALQTFALAGLSLGVAVQLLLTVLSLAVQRRYATLDRETLRAHSERELAAAAGLDAGLAQDWPAPTEDGAA